ncbi:MAG: putative zinc-binding metallopeptidase [Candidatus Omnitrophica bacterium]|nr:putative zinc-binding metallopeptidase [Candidatus Omnitrophota bacterium]
MDIAKLSDEELLALRMCDLPISPDSNGLKDCIEQLYQELDEKGIQFKPVCYLADEWLTPDREPVVGIPFFLAHSALMKLEKKMMFEVEGGTRPWCMQLLRHETGHAINYAYKLYRRKKWQKMFGFITVPYEDTYGFRAYSKNYVRHLKDYYAQCHPDEDFAETFAVWLTPGLNWIEMYKGWKAREKLNYVDSVLQEIKGDQPLVDKGKKYWEVRKSHVTLHNHYKKKQRYFAEDLPDFHDRQLEKIFTRVELSSYQGDMKKNKEKIPFAAPLLRQYRKHIVRSVSRCTREKKYVIDNLLRKIIKRCSLLNFVITEPESIVLLNVTTYITTLIMNSVYTGRYQGAECVKN